MKVEQKIWDKKSGWKNLNGSDLSKKANLVIAFGPENLIKETEKYEELKSMYPTADIVMSSSISGIIGNDIMDSSIVLSALHFEKTKIQTIEVDIREVKDSFDAGAHLSANLDKDDLSGLVVLSDSLPLVNGSHLLTGIYFNLSEHVPVTGGLSSNYNNSSALIGLNKPPETGKIIGIGFSGQHFKIGHGIDAGWTSFGTERFITKAKDNVVYKLDHLTPYEFYTQYLEGIVESVDAASMHFPLGLRLEGTKSRLIRSALSINKKDGSMTFSGDVPEGGSVRMMKTNVSNLIDSAAAAARRSLTNFKIKNPDFSLVINCVGRSEILNEWSQEENDAIINNIGKDTSVMGTYSHGEFSPLDKNKKSELQNQSIIITSFKEI